MTKVSIVVPVYNVQSYLAKCLDSLVNQTYSNIEILVVNDGSTDDSQKSIDEYTEKYPQLIKGYIKSNGGLSDARNYGLDQISGDYVTFVDSDDYVRPTYISSMLKKALEEQADVVVCDMEYVYDHKPTQFSSGGDFISSTIHEMPQLLKINNSACNKLFKSKLFNDIRFIKGIWYEDLATIPKIIIDAEKVCKVDEVLYEYVQRESSIVHTRNLKIFDIYIALSSIQDYITQKNLEKSLKPILETMYVHQGVELTNLRIKDYDEGQIEFLQRNYQLIHSYYPHWYFNAWVWTHGLKKWIGFTLFKFKQFALLLKLYKKQR